MLNQPLSYSRGCSLPVSLPLYCYPGAKKSHRGSGFLVYHYNHSGNIPFLKRLWHQLNFIRPIQLNQYFPYMRKWCKWCLNYWPPCQVLKKNEYEVFACFFENCYTVGAQSIAPVRQNLVNCRRNISAHRTCRELRFFYSAELGRENDLKL